jgi:UDP-3-O-[3-hydroxymyristoyl] glucosamine N-acyltransferase
MPIINETPADGLDMLRQEVQQYVALKDDVSSIEERVAALRKRIMSAVETFGEANEKGSLVLPINDDKSNTTSIVKQRRVSKMFDESKANTVLTEKGIFEQCTKTVTVLDQDAVMAAYYDGKLTDEDIETMFPEKVSWALILEKN